jgi:hypothetical protein
MLMPVNGLNEIVAKYLSWPTANTLKGNMYLRIKDCSYDSIITDHEFIIVHVLADNLDYISETLAVNVMHFTLCYSEAADVVRKGVLKHSELQSLGITSML